MYLKEVQGLRIVAALLVAVYHIWFLRVSGGVDAFFVIAGFFLYRTLFKDGMPDWTRVGLYYKRTLARVLPSASVVITATCLLFFIFDIDSIWPSQIKSAIAALFFVENWWLASESTNYLSRDDLPSPFQQMWALSVQMQLYLTLPVVLLVVAKLSSGGAGRTTLVLAGLFALAFAYALFETARNQPFAYFNTGARVWEFLAGVLLACSLSRIRCSERVAKGLGYGALLVLVTFAAVLPVATLFPGIAALIPVLATMAIIVAATNGGNIEVLNAPITQKLGDISFTFYLWHWPLLILVWQLTGELQIGLLPGLAIILVSGILAYGTYEYCEKPFRRSRLATGNGLVAVSASLALMLPALGAAGLWSLAYIDSRDTARAELRAFTRGEAVEAPFVPATIIAKSDVPRVYGKGCVQRWGKDDVLECTFGNPEGSVLAVLVGGSHSAHWLPALEDVAKARTELKIITMLKGNCPLAAAPGDLDLQADCLRWSQTVIDRVHSLAPDVVVSLLTSTRGPKGVSLEHVPSEFHETWSALEDHRILAVRDTPRAPYNILDCVARLGPEHPACFRDEEIALTLGPDPVPDLPPHIFPLDLTDHLCPTGTCPSVIDGVLVHRDASHVTATFAASLAGVFQAALVTMGVLSSE